MSVLKLAKDFEKKVAEHVNVDPSMVVTEHEGTDPVSYMAFSNLENLITDASELLSILNSKDDLPQWVDELLAISKNNVSKALGYVRSEKIPNEHDELITEAQDRGYLSRFKGFFNKPKTESEIKMHEFDAEFRNLFKNYGPGEKSLDQRIYAAKEHIENKKFIAARRELNYFNEALEQIANLSSSFISSALPSVNAGFFDMFKAKKEEPSIQEPGLSSGAYFPVRRGLLELLYSAGQLQKFFKNILFPALDRALSENNVRSYSSMLKEFLSEQKSFEAKFDQIEREAFVYLDTPSEEVLRSTFKNFKQQQKDLPDYVSLKNLETSPAPIKALKFEDQSLVPPLNTSPIKEYDLPEPYAVPAQLVSSVPKEWSKEKKSPFLSSFQPPKEIDECPCGSRLPWQACHGTDIDRIKNIMNNKNVSYEEAERRYRTWVNLNVGLKSQIEAKEEAKRQEEIDKIREQYLQVVKMFKDRNPTLRTA